MGDILGGAGQFLPLVAMFVVLYLFFLRPQMKKQKQEVEFTKSIKKGDRIVTKSGMHGKVVDLNDNDNTFVLETGAGKIKFERSALSYELTQKLSK